MSPLTVSFDQSAFRRTLGQSARDQGDAEVVKSPVTAGSEHVSVSRRAVHTRAIIITEGTWPTEPLFSPVLHVQRYIRARARPRARARVRRY